MSLYLSIKIKRIIPQHLGLIWPLCAAGKLWNLKDITSSHFYLLNRARLIYCSYPAFAYLAFPKCQGTASLWGGWDYYHYPHFTDGEAEASEAMTSKVTQPTGDRLGLAHKEPDSRTYPVELLPHPGSCSSRKQALWLTEVFNISRFQASSYKLRIKILVRAIDSLSFPVPGKHAFHFLLLPQSPRVSRRLPCCSFSGKKDRGPSTCSLSSVKGLTGSRGRRAELTEGSVGQLLVQNRSGLRTGAAQGEACGGNGSLWGQVTPNQCKTLRGPTLSPEKTDKHVSRLYPWQGHGQKLWKNITADDSEVGF